MSKIKIYLDTSVENYLTEYDVFISEIVYLEINKTRDENRRKKLLDAIERFELETYNDLNDEIESLANSYIHSGIIPENKMEDALHIAYCTYYDFDILLSWNFKHLANIKKQYQINSLNKTLGYRRDLNLFNPMEVIYEK